MTTTPPPTDERETTWRRRFASRANNRGWALSEQPARTAGPRTTEMLHAAHASAHLWEPIATDRQRAHADLLLAQVHALLGDAGPASRHARAAFAFVNGNASDPWESALATRSSRTPRIAGRTRTVHRSEYATAKRLIEAIENQEEKDILLRDVSVSFPCPALDVAASSTEARIDTFLERYSPEIESRLRESRATLRGHFPPHGHELVFDNYNALVFGFSPSEKQSERSSRSRAIRAGSRCSF